MDLGLKLQLKQIAAAGQAKKPVIAVDFDGVLHQYTGDMKQMNEPVQGALEGIRSLLSAGIKIVIHSARPAAQIIPWLKQYGFPALPVTNKKPVAQLYLDDRGVQFRGDWSPTLIQYLLRFSPYWEQAIQQQKQKESQKPAPKPKLKPIQMKQVRGEGSEWFESYGGLAMVPTAHPPSLKNPRETKVDWAQDGWRKGDSKEKKKQARNDLKTIHQRLRRQSGKPELAQRAIYPVFPSMYHHQ